MVVMFWVIELWFVRVGVFVFAPDTRPALRGKSEKVTAL
jgi:hypothetical protein